MDMVCLFIWLLAVLTSVDGIQSLRISTVKVKEKEVVLHGTYPFTLNFQDSESSHPTKLTQGRALKSIQSPNDGYLGSFEYRSQDYFNTTFPEIHPSERLRSHTDVAGRNISMTGGSLGSYYETFVDEGAYVSKLKIWAAKSCIKAIRMSSSSGNDYTIGDPYERGPWPSQEFVFHKGEIVKSATLWGNGKGTRTGWIEIVTSEDRTFSYGMTEWGRKTGYPAKVYSGIIIGAAYRTIVGSNNGPRDVMAFAFVFMKPIATAELRNTTYASFGDISLIILDQGSFNCDLGGGPPCHGWNLGGTTSKTITHTWTTSNGTETLVSVGVKADAPELFLKPEGKVEWKTEMKVEESLTNTDTVVISWSLNGPTVLCRTIHVNASVAVGNSNVRYKGIIFIDFEDGTHYNYPVAGLYTGVTYSSIVTHQSMNYTC